jgi:hypothetical protein
LDFSEEGGAGGVAGFDGTARFGGADAFAFDFVCAVFLARRGVFAVIAGAPPRAPRVEVVSAE